MWTTAVFVNALVVDVGELPLLVMGFLSEQAARSDTERSSAADLDTTDIRDPTGLPFRPGGFP
jgi:hypothetical protein